jgi:hypothetical protein
LKDVFTGYFFPNSISAGAIEHIGYSRYARAMPSLRSSTVPRLTMMCMLGNFGGVGRAKRAQLKKAFKADTSAG